MICSDEKIHPLGVTIIILGVQPDFLTLSSTQPHYAQKCQGIAINNIVGAGRVAIYFEQQLKISS